MEHPVVLVGVAAAASGVAPLVLVLVSALAYAVKGLVRRIQVAVVYLLSLFGVIVLDVWTNVYVKGPNMFVLTMELIFGALVGVVVVAASIEDAINQRGVKEAVDDFRAASAVRETDPVADDQTADGTEDS